MNPFDKHSDIEYRTPHGANPQPCAVHCWFPTKSDPIPTMIKILDQEGNSTVIKQIDQLSCNHISSYAGDMIEYHCYVTTPDNLRLEIYLHFHKRKLKWTISTK